MNDCPKNDITDNRDPLLPSAPLRTKARLFCHRHFQIFISWLV